MPKWLLVLCFCLHSVSLEVAIRRDYSSNLEEKVFSFLVRNGFIVTVSEEMIRDKRTFRATKAVCRMLVTPISHRGWERDIINSRATGADQVFIVFGGKIYAEQPTWLTASDFVRYKLLSELGSNVRPTPVIAVLAAKNCAAEQLPWYELSSAEPGSK
jgi:hypothetical protein